MTDKPQIEKLLEKYAFGTASVAEVNELTQLLKANNHDDEIKSLLERTAENTEADRVYDQGTLDNIIQKILGSTESAKVIPFNTFTRRKFFTRIAAAVAIVILLSLGGYFIFKNDSQKQIARTETQLQRFKNDVAPGSSKAILTLANGSQIILDSAANGTLAQQGNTKIINNYSGRLIYNTAPSSLGGGVEISYNTLSTPRGGQFQLTLPDGSRVWLNAVSSITYPVSFTGSKRKVSVTGEIYFEVAHNTKMPFIVQHNDVAVQVLGTHFNVNAYDDEAMMTTTLLEGSVKILRQAQDEKAVVIKPGQQAAVSKNGEIKVASGVDVDEVMGWKNGLFHFESADLKTILRQFARWYDVEIIYEGNINDKKYFCIVNKNTSLQNVLKTLQAGDIKFRIEGKKLFVQQ